MLTREDSSTCSRCGEQVVTDFKHGRIFCPGCGLVKVERFIDPTSEYRFFIENTSVRNDPRRVGNIVNFHLDSQIDLVDINQGKNSYHNYATQTSNDKKYTNAIRFIKRFCDLLDLRESVIKQVEEIYCEVQTQPELKGKRLELIVAGCIFLACKRNHVNVQPTALEPILNVSQAKILKIAKIILRHIPPIKVSPAEYVDLFCSKLGVTEDARKKMKDICTEINNWDFFQSTLPKPRSIAGAVIYFVLSQGEPENRRSLEEIKSVAGILTDTTVTKYHKILQDHEPQLTQLLNKKSEEAT